MKNTKQIWECKIGEVDGGDVPRGGDAPMRNAVAAAYKSVTGVAPTFIFSGWGASLTEVQRAVVENRLPDTQHEDDFAVDRFAEHMKWKLNDARSRGKSGWQDRSWTPEQISAELRRHVDKGDPVDVANYCMFLSARGEPITPAPTPAWHDAPTCAGLWLCNYGILEVVCINQPDVDNFDDFYNAGGRWYGPIPQYLMAEGGAA